MSATVSFFSDLILYLIVLLQQGLPADSTLQRLLEADTRSVTSSK